LVRQLGYQQAPAADEQDGWVDLDTGRPLAAVQADCESI
jgi:hypothetical protein